MVLKNKKSGLAVLLGAACLIAPHRSEASMLVTVIESAGTVIASWSGTVDVTGLPLLGSYGSVAGDAVGVDPAAGLVAGDGASASPVDAYFTPGASLLSASSTFGPGGLVIDSTGGTGMAFGFAATGAYGWQLLVPSGFVSGPLSGTGVLLGTFASLGIDFSAGDVVVSLGNASGDTVTISGAASVPDGGMSLSLIGMAFGGLAMLRRRL